MSSNFEWQTDETEQLWEKPASDPTPPPPNSRRRWLMIAIIGLLLLGAGAGVAYQITQRVDSVTAELTNSVFSSANLVHQSVETQDEELFLNLVSGADTDWVDDQLAFFNQDHFYDRDLFGLTAKSLPPLVFEETNSSAVANVTFTPELNEAQVHTYQPYTAYLPDGSTDSITLEQVTVFRPGSSRWLMANPSAEFWGEWQTESGDPIDVGYFERDEAVVAQLRDDLTDVVAQVCSDIDGLECPDDLHLTLTFWDDPGILTRVAPVSAEGNSLLIELPSPSIVGLPIDDAGEDVLKRGYGRLVATAVIAHLTEYECCQHGAFFLAAVDAQLADLGLIASPFSAEILAAHRTESTTLRDLSQVWPYRNADSFDADQMALATLFIDFARTMYPDISLTDIQRTMNTSALFRIWVNDAFASIVTDNRLPSSQISTDWWIYLYQQGSRGISAEMPAINQQLQLICEVDGRFGLTTFDPINQSFNEPLILYDDQEFAIAAPSPNDKGSIANLVRSGNEQFIFELGLWWENEWQLIESVEGSYLYTTGQASPDGSQLLTYGINFDEGTVLPHLNDLTDCDANGCAQTALPAVPIWSPDGSRVLMAQTDSTDRLFASAANYLFFFSSPISQLGTLQHTGQFWHRPADEISAELDEPTARGFAPFWLSNDTYGYLSFNGFPNTQLLLADADTDEPFHTLSDKTLRDAIPADERPEDLFLAYAYPNPANPDQLVLGGFSPSNATAQPQFFVFFYNPTTEELDQVMSMAPQMEHLIGYSPDGRYLTIVDLFDGSLGRWASLDGESSRVILIDTATGEQSVFPAASMFGSSSWGDLTTFDWTSDGQWLSFMMDAETLGLVHPGTNQAQTVTSPACHYPIWVDPPPAE